MDVRMESARVITALRTPYEVVGDIDTATFEHLLQFQQAAGVHGVVVGGTTGDGHLLEWPEHMQLTERALASVGQKMVVIVNCGSNFTRKAVLNAEHALAAGAHATLQVAPYYGMTSEAGLLQHFKEVLAVGPTVVYNVPKRSQDIPPSVMLQLAEHENFIGIKECAGSERIAQYVQRGVRCWSGNDDDAIVSRHQSGATGVISVVANLVPAVVVRLMNEMQAQDEIRLRALLESLSGEPNPIPVATALAMTGAIKSVFRLPYVPMGEQYRGRIIDALNQFDEGEVAGGDPKFLADSDFTLRT